MARLGLARLGEAGPGEAGRGKVGWRLSGRQPYFKTINVNHNEDAMKIRTESTRHIKTQGFEAVGRLVLEALPGNVAATRWDTLINESAWLGVLTEFMSLGPAVRPELAEHMRAIIARVSSGSTA